MFDFTKSGGFGGFLAAQQMHNDQLKTEVQKGDLGFKLQDLEFRRQKQMQDMAQNISASLDAQVAELEKNLYKEAPFDPAPDMKFTEMANGLASRTAQVSRLMGLSDEMATQRGRDVLGRLFRAASAPRQQSVSPNTTIISQSPGSISEQYRGPAAPTAPRTVEVPGEYGTTRISEGGIPAPPSGVLNGRQATPGQVPMQQPTWASSAPTPVNMAPGQTGKPLPQDAQDTVTSGLTMLKALDTMEKNLKESGVVKGRISKAQTGPASLLLGENKGAADFETARSNLTAIAQSIIKGTPSNFDIQSFQKTLPDLAEPLSVNQSRMKFTRDMVKQLISDTISYYKYTGSRIPQDVATRAKEAGVKVESVAPWNGEGNIGDKSSGMLAKQLGGAPARAGQRPQAEQQTSSELDAAQHKGMRMKDVNGKVYRSDGTKWVLEQ